MELIINILLFLLILLLCFAVFLGLLMQFLMIFSRSHSSKHSDHTYWYVSRSKSDPNTFNVINLSDVISEIDKRSS